MNKIKAIATNAMIEAGWSAWIAADNNGCDEHTCFVGGLAAAMEAQPESTLVELIEALKEARLPKASNERDIAWNMAMNRAIEISSMIPGGKGA